MLKLWTFLCLTLSLFLVFYGAWEFQRQFEEEPIFPGPGVTRIGSLSQYHPPLAGTAGDTDVYYLEGEEAGATIFVLGGNHPNEPASLVTAVLLIENMVVEVGRAIIIPRGNASAFTHTGPQEAHPSSFTIETGEGERWFRFGDRLTNPVHQWPDPDIYMHSSGETLAGVEMRNLNRAFPGTPHGTLTQQVAYAILRLLQEEGVGLAIDIHEASPEYPVVNALVAHNQAMDLAAMVVLDLQLEGVNISLEPSPQNLRGLSHREWGDHSSALSVLLETANPSMGRIRGPTDEDLVVTGKDIIYHRASSVGALSVVVPEEGIHLDERVARHVATVKQLFASYPLLTREPFVFWNVPSYNQILGEGVGEFLKPVVPWEGEKP